MPMHMCETHQTVIEINGNQRKLNINMNMPNNNKCIIPKTKEITEGTFDECVIKKIRD